MSLHKVLQVWLSEALHALAQPAATQRMLKIAQQEILYV